MNEFIGVVVIIAVVFILGGFISIWMKHKQSIINYIKSFIKWNRRK